MLYGQGVEIPHLMRIRIIIVMDKAIQAGKASNMGRSVPRGETCCPACGELFKIHPNRTFKITGKNRFMNFVEGLEQFQNHRDVICPACGKRFNSPDSRLFGVFRSSWTVWGLALVFDALLLLYVYFEVICK
jgi:uncharacterized Zn-finger protein